METSRSVRCTCGYSFCCRSSKSKFLSVISLPHPRRVRIRKPSRDSTFSSAEKFHTILLPTIHTYTICIHYIQHARVFAIAVDPFRTHRRSSSGVSATRFNGYSLDRFRNGRWKCFTVFTRMKYLLITLCKRNRKPVYVCATCERWTVYAAA